MNVFLALVSTFRFLTWSHCCDGDDTSFFDGLDALPATTQPLLPQADPIVSRADSQNITAQTPADTPCDSFNIKHRGFPIAFSKLASCSCI